MRFGAIGINVSDLLQPGQRFQHPDGSWTVARDLYEAISGLTVQPTGGRGLSPKLATGLELIRRRRASQTKGQRTRKRNQARKRRRGWR